MSFGTVGAGGKLSAKRISPHPVRSLNLPGIGRVMFTRDRGNGLHTARSVLHTHLQAHHFDGDGKLKGHHNLGSGLTTQGLVLALANQGVTANNLGNTLGLLKYMASGTGTTAATAYDYELQTQSGPVSTATTPTIGISADNATMQWVSTLAYTSTLAITEWGLFAGGGTVGSQYNTSADAFTATTATPTTSPSWTAHQWAGAYICQVASATSVIGLITDNSATALTVNPGWADQTSGGGAGSTPSSNTAMNIYPLMADHKVFSAINVVNGDSITFTYSLTCQSGG
ncbi:MAG: hypothetical protein ACYCQK_02065 [Acidiferrobacteraceae bacterium]